MFESEFAQETIEINGRTFTINEPDIKRLTEMAKNETGMDLYTLIIECVECDGQKIPPNTRIPSSLASKLAPIVTRVVGSAGNDQ